MPQDWVLQLMNGVHRGVLKLTGGRIGWKIAGMPALELTTIGRRTGQERPVMLISPLQEGETIVVVASRGGDDRHPSWFTNLVAHPEVSVSYAGAPPQSMRARVASPEERARLWPQVSAKAPNYAGYQRRTTREIPLVLLEPLVPEG